MAKKKVDLTEKPVDKEKALEELMKQVTRQYGQGSIMKLGDNQKLNVDTISTGSINLDKALGIGGLPRGRIIEIYGAESSGKTTMSLHVIAEAQKAGGIAAFVDAEHALDPIYAKALGVNIDELLISQPDNGEQALDIVDMLVRSGAIDIIVVDSVAALVPKVEIEGDMTDQQVGLQARLMAKGLRRLTGNISKSNTVLVFINQIRDKIGGFGTFPGATTTSGGRALKFFSSVRLEIKKMGSIKQGDESVGNLVLAKVTKNKVASPFKEARFDIIFGEGISRVGELFTMALDYNICTRSGSWFSFGDKKLGQGEINVRNIIKNDPELLAELEAKVFDAMEHPEKYVFDKKSKKKKSDKEEIEDED